MQYFKITVPGKHFYIQWQIRNKFIKKEREKINLCSLYNFNLIINHVNTVVGSVLHKNISEGNLITL